MLSITALITGAIYAGCSITLVASTFLRRTSLATEWDESSAIPNFKDCVFDAAKFGKAS